MRFFIIISFFFLSISSVLSEENIENAIESDEIEYFNETGELKALGSVKIMPLILVEKITFSLVLQKHLLNIVTRDNRSKYVVL